MVDQSVLKLVRAMLRAGVMESGIVRHPVTGTPQGGVISPLMCNVYLHRLDWECARQRCWRADWVIDLDIQKFFDTVPWDLVERAVAHHISPEQRWILLYVKRWLRAPLAQPDGTLVARDRGTPQGSAISPLLANLFMHYAFDAWMVREFPNIGFERYCDDPVVHCGSEQQARLVRDAIAARLEQVGLALHPDKTRIVCVPRAQRERWDVGRRPWGWRQTASCCVG